MLLILRTVSYTHLDVYKRQGLESHTTRNYEVPGVKKKTYYAINSSRYITPGKLTDGDSVSAIRYGDDAATLDPIVQNSVNFDAANRKIDNIVLSTTDTPCVYSRVTA